MNAHDVAAESYRFWRRVGYPHLQACAWLAMEDGETSFRLGVVGDHGKAFGPFQHQRIRLDAIAAPKPKGCGIDIRNPATTHLEALYATDWETTAGAYKRVRPALLAATTRDEAVADLVKRFEQSADQSRDIRRRAHLFDYWAKIFAG